MKTIYLTESQKHLLLREARLDYERINIVLDAINKLGYQKIEMRLPNGTVKIALVPTNVNGEFLQNKAGVVTKSFDDIFFILQLQFKNDLTDDHKYRDELIKHCIAHWAFPERYQLWLGTGAVSYVDNTGNPLFTLA